MKYLIQHGDERVGKLLDIGTPWHKSYCARHGWEYRLDRSTELPGQEAYWEKLRVIDSALKTMNDGDLVLFLDADALIVKPWVDFFEDRTENYGEDDWPEKALFVSEIAMARYPGMQCWNAGVIFVRVNPYMRTFFAKCLEHGPVNDEEWEKHGMGHMSVGWEERRLAFEVNSKRVVGEISGKPWATIQNLDSRWNYGNAVRPLIGEAKKRACIFHPAERTVKEKYLLMLNALEHVEHGEVPTFDLPEGSCC